jgi:hypothetical protein
VLFRSLLPGNKLAELRDARLDYARERFAEALAHVGVTEAVFCGDGPQMPRQPHLVAERRKVFERMREIRGGRRISYRDIERIVGCSEGVVWYSIFHNKQPEVIDQARAEQIRDEAMLKAGVTIADFVLRSRRTVGRDLAVAYMRERQADGTQLSLNRISWMMYGKRNSSAVVDALKRHTARQVAA